MKKILFSLLTLALVTGITSSALASDKSKEIYKAANTYYEQEPNNTLDEADVIPLAGSFTIHGTIGDLYDADYFFIPRPKTDKKIRVTITAKDPKARYRVVMNTSTGGTYGRAYTLPGNTNNPTSFETTVGTKKDYHFIVRCLSFNDSHTSQEYTVNVTDITDR
ncbi:hypothetical protein [Brevibacillus laterosporus]|uniref:hypothetical protein n=1 Tax=Brevibacillus laterosporus TaxID=1465 RepID=UPI000E6B5946|nr:hypothetical protein [Brevibacillus laterosporus]AYB38543.1 hypothetical protein D5F52_09880 [Brevibacillus laterosporus]MBM7110725.1 hypothetical protein [Brevibacillus laterosporus]